MRAAAFLIFLLSLGARAQGAPDAFEITQRFANSGMSQLALARVVELQPALPTAPRWGDWEQLRCALLSQLHRHEELAQRAAALPDTAPDKVAQFCMIEGARAASAVARGANARAILARLIWRRALSVDEARRARLLVIESYLSEGRPQDAFALMLRYQQDYRPVDRDTAARFVDGLVAAGMEQEAVNWLAQLDDASPLKLLLRLGAKLMAPEAAVAQARAALAKTGANTGWWSVLRRAAVLQKDRILNVEALEHLLQLVGDRPPERARALAAELWQTYADAAQEIGNQNHLLVGDDANWADYAARRGGASPALARAIFAYLAQRSAANSTRQGAQLQLAFSLRSDELALTALRLFSDATRFPVERLDPQARHLLGSMAAEHNQPAAAGRFWSGLDAPPTFTSDEWNLRLAQVLARAGAAVPAAAALNAVMAGKQALPAETAQRVIAAAQALHDAGHGRAANEIYRVLLPRVEAPLRRELLFALGRNAEADAGFQRAADYFLQAALLLDAGAADALAINARLAAAVNLGRAGLKDDARAQLNWLQKNVKDADKLELIRRELQKL